jgi:heptosyltransferase-2
MSSPPFLPKTILLMKPGAVGDLLQLTPVLRALKRTYPAARLTLMVGNGSSASLFAHDPNVDETIVFDRRRTSITALWRHLLRSRFDLVLNFQRSNLRAWFLASAAFPCRLLIYHKAKKRQVHAVVNYLETLAPLGIPSTDTELKMYLGAEDRSFAKELFRSQGLEKAMVVALNPGATHPVNRWPTERFAELADRLHQDLGARSVIIGGPDDVPLADEIVSRSRTKPLSLAGKTLLLQLGALLELCSAVVSGDTGPMHMATAVGTPVIALFGAADPARTGPVGSGHRVIRAGNVPCVPCRSRTCSNSNYLECMQKITVAEVSDAVKEAVRRRS